MKYKKDKKKKAASSWNKKSPAGQFHSREISRESEFGSAFTLGERMQFTRHDKDRLHPYPRLHLRLRLWLIR